MPRQKSNQQFQDIIKQIIIIKIIVKQFHSQRLPALLLLNVTSTWITFLIQTFLHGRNAESLLLLNKNHHLRNAENLLVFYYCKNIPKDRMLRISYNHHYSHGCNTTPFLQIYPYSHGRNAA